jgi:hypothetical protein
MWGISLFSSFGKLQMAWLVLRSGTKGRRSTNVVAFDETTKMGKERRREGERTRTGLNTCRMPAAAGINARHQAPHM